MAGRRGESSEKAKEKATGAGGAEHARKARNGNAIVGKTGPDPGGLEALPVDDLPQALALLAQRRRLRRRPVARSGTNVPETPAWRAPNASSSTQRQGAQAEDAACRYLQARGARILARNVQTRRGEIDVVCVDAGVLAFVEVRQRASPRYGGAAASVGKGKQARLICAAQALLPRLVQRHFGGQTPPCRFDVLAVQGADMVWFRHAFAACA